MKGHSIVLAVAFCVVSLLATSLPTMTQRRSDGAPMPVVLAQAATTAPTVAATGMLTVTLTSGPAFTPTPTKQAAVASVPARGLCSIDPAWIVLLASVVSGFAGHVYVMRKERAQWEREHKAEEARAMREKETVQTERRLEAYQNCIRALSVMAARGSDRDWERWDQYLEEAHAWLSLVSLRRPEVYRDTTSNFRLGLNEFTAKPTSSSASKLLRTVGELAMSDKSLFPDAAPEPEKKPP